MHDGNAGDFWLGYKGETKAILDEFSGRVMSPLTFQRLADIYPYTFNVKGGSAPCNVVELHVCSNFLPHEWWGEKTKFNQQAIYRRIVEVHWHYAFKKYRRYVSEEGYLEDETKQAMYKFIVDKGKIEFQKPINVIS